MMTAKQEVIKVLDTLSDDVSLEDIQYHLYVLQRVERARQDIGSGHVISQEEVEARMKRWLGE